MIKLLIVDDDAVFRTLVERHACSLDFAVYSAENGRAALDILQEKKINILVLDWMMPGMTGIELCARIRKQKTNEYRYIILLTSRNQTRDIVEGLTAGADDYITKPFNQKELQARLNIGKRIITLQQQLMSAKQKLHQIAIHDNLTRLFNRGEILRNLEEKLNQAKRERQPLGVILLDVDHFKQVNDRYGHQTGDSVLVEIARRMQKTLRPYDKVGRYGGEEFLIVLPNCDRVTTCEVGERIRKNIGGSRFKTREDSIRVTISLGGVVTDPARPISAQELLHRSDMALYRSKNDGRNRVTVYSQAMQNRKKTGGTHEYHLSADV